MPAELRTRLRGVEKELDDEINAKNRFAESFQKAKPAEQSPLFRQTQRFRLRLKDDRLKASEPKTDDEVKRLRDEAQKIRRVLGSPRVLELHQIMEQNPDLWRKLDRLEPRGGPIRHP